MNRISLIEKLGILWKVSLSSYLFPIVLVLLIGISLYFLDTNPNNRKRNKYLYIAFSSFIAILITVIYYPSLNQFFDYFMDHVFIAILFPNPALYFCMIIVMNVIVWISLFYYKTNNIIKRVNVIIYIIMNYLLALLLKVVNVTKLDIFQETSLFSSKKATALLELSSSIFVIWIIFLILYRVILIYIRKEYKPKIKKIIISRKKLPENYRPVSPPDFLQGNAGKRITIIEKVEPKEEIKEEVKEETDELEKMLTVEDYRLLRKLLKEEKEKEIIDLEEKEKQLERERIAEMKLQEKMREEEKFTELEMLYRSIK